MRKGILLAGGAGSRLYPATAAISKQLLPIYDKPMIYYPLSILMLAGIEEILIISTPQDTPRFEKMLGSGALWGIRLHYAVQQTPRGLAESLIIAEKFLDNHPCCLILGDNLFYGNALSLKLQEASSKKEGATIFACRVNHPEQYGVVELSPSLTPLSIEEKPKTPKSRWAVTGLYFFDEKASSLAKTLTPSKRGELEITDLNLAYLNRGTLDVKLLNRGITWLDTGTFDALLEASLFIQTLQKRQGIQIACLEEIAYKRGLITLNDLEKNTHSLKNTPYGQYLIEMIEEEKEALALK